LSLLALLTSFLVVAVTVSKIALYFGLPMRVQVEGLLSAIQGRPLLLLALTVTAGAVEELLTRVYILPHLAVLLKSPRWAIVASSALFALAHFDGHDLMRVVPPFLIGLILGAHYWRYRSIGAIVAGHFLWDWILLTVISAVTR
jgi:membrane protease YdiL (CAAX protease family)